MAEYSNTVTKSNYDNFGGNIGSMEHISTAVSISQSEPYHSRYVIENTSGTLITYTLGPISTAITDIQNGYYTVIYNTVGSTGPIDILNNGAVMIVRLFPGQSALLTSDTSLPLNWQAMMGYVNTPFLTARVAYVDLFGDNTTGVVEDPTHPFLTAQAAITAISASKAPGDVWTVLLGDGSFGAITLPDEINVMGKGTASVIGPVTSGSGASGIGAVIAQCTIVGASPAITMATDLALTVQQCRITADAYTGTQTAIDVSGGRLILDSCICIFNPTYTTGDIYYINTTGITRVAVTMINSKLDITTVAGSADSLEVIHHDNANVGTVVSSYGNTITLTTAGTGKTVQLARVTANGRGTVLVRDDIVRLNTDLSDSILLYVNVSTASSTLNASGVSVTTSGVYAALSAGALTNVGDLNITNLRWESDQGPFRPTNSGSGVLNYSAVDHCGSSWYAGGEAIGYTTVTGPYTATVCDRTLVVSNSNTVITLPAANLIEGRMLLVKLANGISNVRVAPSGLDTLNGGTQYTLGNDRDTLLVQSDGITNWSIIALTEPLLNPVYNPNATAELNVYVDVTGNDANSGLEAGRPVLTIDRALDVIEEFGWNTGAVINLSAGNFTFTTGKTYAFRTTARGANGGYYLLSGATPTVVDSLTTAAISNTQLAPSNLINITTTTALVAGAYKGLSLVVTSGTLTGTTLCIADNSTTDIYVMTTTLYTPADITTFDIIQNSTTLTSTGVKFTGRMLIMRNIDILLTNTLNGNSLGFFDSFVVHDNVVYRPASVAATAPSLLFFGCAVIDPIFVTSLVDNYTPVPAGVVYNFSSILGSGSLNLQFVNTYAVTNCTYYDNVNASTQSSNVLHLVLYMNSCLGFQAARSLLLFNNAVVRNSPSGSGTFFQIQNESTLSLDNIQYQDNNMCMVRGENSYITCNNGLVNYTAPLAGDGFAEGINTNFTFNNFTVNISASITRSFDQCDVTLGGTTSNTSTATWNFRFCRCSFSNFTDSGAHNLDFNSCSAEFNNFTRNSTPGNTVFYSSTLRSNTLIIDTPTIGGFAALQFYNSSYYEGGNVTLSNVANAITIYGENSDININVLSLVTATQLTGTGSRWRISSYNMTGMGTQTNVLTDCIMRIANIVAEAEDVAWNILGGSFTITSMNHSGLMSRPYITSSNGASISLGSNSVGTSNVTGTQQAVMVMDDSSVRIENCNFQDVLTVATALVKFRSFTLLNTDVGSSTPLTGGFMELHNGEVYINIINTAVNAIGANGIYLVNCSGTIDSVTTKSQGPNSVRLEDCGSITVTRCNLNDSIGTQQAGIYCFNSRFNINNTFIQGYADGIYMLNNSQGYITQVSGVGIIYGIRMGGNSSFTNFPGTNTLNGGTADILVGALGGQSWANVDSTTAAFTNDFGTANPQYASIGF